VPSVAGWTVAFWWRAVWAGHRSERDREHTLANFKWRWHVDTRSSGDRTDRVIESVELDRSTMEFQPVGRGYHESDCRVEPDLVRHCEHRRKSSSRAGRVVEAHFGRADKSHFLLRQSTLHERRRHDRYSVTNSQWTHRLRPDSQEQGEGVERVAQAACLGPDDIEAIYKAAVRNFFAQGVP
jgi:hypothetical protein